MPKQGQMSLRMIFHKKLKSIMQFINIYVDRVIIDVIIFICRIDRCKGGHSSDGRAQASQA